MCKSLIVLALSLGSIVPTMVYATECSQLAVNTKAAATMSAEDTTCTINGNPLIIEILSSNNFTQDDESRTADVFMYLSQIINEKNLNQVSLISGNSVMDHIITEWYFLNNVGRYSWGTWYTNSWKSFSNNTKKSYINLAKKALELNPTISEKSLDILKEISEEAVKLDIKI
jgi:hypothetical protein